MSYGAVARQVAGRLGRSTATTYDLIARGQLTHVHVLNSIGSPPAGLETFIKALRKR